MERGRHPKRQAKGKEQRRRRLAAEQCVSRCCERAPAGVCCLFSLVELGDHELQLILRRQGQQQPPQRQPSFSRTGQEGVEAAWLGCPAACVRAGSVP